MVEGGDAVRAFLRGVLRVGVLGGLAGLFAVTVHYVCNVGHDASWTIYVVSYFGLMIVERLG